MDPHDSENGSSSPSPSAPAPLPAEPDPKLPAGTATYLDKVVMFIPASLNLAYVAALGIMADQTNGSAPAWLHWAVFLSLWALTPLYVIYLPNAQQEAICDSKRFRVLAASIAFPIWCYAINGTALALSYPEFYQPVYGSLLLIVTALVLPVLEKILCEMSFFKAK
ncbi:MAG: hypothetical protein AB7W16_29225 [Candidatus Obscuribacterales bacterium]